MRDSIVAKQALCDLADATKLFCLEWKAITSDNITSASLFKQVTPFLRKSSHHHVSRLKVSPYVCDRSEGRRPHCLEDCFDPYLSFSSPSPEFSLSIQGKGTF
ncbi:MAG: hypothetical protein EZS28_027649 [Streblomastix strix]|uniref:Uncharacterized protein n=1 Tax=Streblomastix strix TaxID=222440 RepID=A0A5J4V2Z9_9EUKA|nr:MAG: hypothetical protein EZS28_027649 [Streblomastix strix]